MVASDGAADRDLPFAAQQINLLTAGNARAAAQAQTAVGAGVQATIAAVSQANQMAQRQFQRTQTMVLSALLSARAQDQQINTLAQDQLTAAQTWAVHAVARLQTALATHQAAIQKQVTLNQQAAQQAVVQLALANANRPEQWKTLAGQLYQQVRDAVALAAAHAVLEWVNTVATVVSTILAIAGLEPAAGLVFAIGRVAALANASIYALEGNYLSAGSNLLMAILPGPGEGASSAGETISKDLAGAAERDAELTADKLGAEAAEKEAASEGVLLNAEEKNAQAFGSCGRPGECFTGDTQVIVGVNPDGSYQTAAIDTVQVGQEVLTRADGDPSAPLEEEAVTGVQVHTVYSLREVTVTMTNGASETIDTTDSHPFYVQGEGWVSAEDLPTGAVLVSPDGQVLTVVGTTSVDEPQGVAVYTLTVDQDHTFFVEPDAGVGFDAVWVHNGCADAIELRENLILAGENEEKYAAHIVPTGDFTGRSLEVQKAVARSQSILEEADIELNEAANGFFTDSTSHLGTHTDKFLIDLSTRLEGVAGNPEGIQQLLADVKAEVLGI